MLYKCLFPPFHLIILNILRAFHWRVLLFLKKKKRKSILFLSLLGLSFIVLWIMYMFDKIIKRYCHHYDTLMKWSNNLEYLIWKQKNFRAHHHRTSFGRLFLVSSLPVLVSQVNPPDIKPKSLSTLLWLWTSPFCYTHLGMECTSIIFRRRKNR